MLLSHSRRFIFVHIYKNAGTSIRTALRKYCEPGILCRILRRVGGCRCPDLPAHMPATEIRDSLPQEVFSSYFKFAIVRNPWDWVVSLYNYILQMPAHVDHAAVKALRSFEEYIDWWMVDRRKTQKSFISNERGRILVDFVGRYESLERDFAAVCSRIGISRTLPHANRSSKGRPYREFFCDRTRRILQDALADDIDTFGYTFDGAR